MAKKTAKMEATPQPESDPSVVRAFEPDNAFYKTMMAVKQGIEKATLNFDKTATTDGSKNPSEKDMLEKAFGELASLMQSVNSEAMTAGRLIFGGWPNRSEYMVFTNGIPSLQTDPINLAQQAMLQETDSILARLEKGIASEVLRVDALLDRLNSGGH